MSSKNIYARLTVCLVNASIGLFGGKMAKDALAKYRERRDLDTSPEPKGGTVKPHEKPLFVIQKHDATRLHYDFRLEIDGVLVSWAVPKGPSTDPSEKRLAIRTDDHPLEHADFEGVIPEENYGAGPVLIWDRGTYKNVKYDEDDKLIPMSKALEMGEITVALYGEKLRGAYALIRADRNDREQWLLIKTDDDKADARRNLTSTEPKSVVSGRTIDEILKKETRNHSD